MRLKKSLSSLRMCASVYARLCNNMAIICHYDDCIPCKPACACVVGGKGCQDKFSKRTIHFCMNTMFEPGTSQVTKECKCDFDRKGGYKKCKGGCKGEDVAYAMLHEMAHNCQPRIFTDTYNEGNADDIACCLMDTFLPTWGSN